MRIDARTIGAGVGLLLTGAIPLAVMQGAVELTDVSWATRLWPLVLVGAGLALVLDRTPIGFVGHARAGRSGRRDARLRLARPRDRSG